ncbi:MAG: ABC transporter permease, partial [Stellaceae bacterium]
MILGAFERMIAFRYLRSRRQEGFVSVIAVFSLLGIMLGVATLIIVMAVMNGFRADLLDRILGFNGHLTVYSTPGAPLNDFDQIAAKIKAVPGVTAAYPEIEGQVMATSRDQSSGVLVRGVSAQTIQAQSLIAKNLSPDALAGFNDGGIIIGQRLALKLGVRRGDSVTLISPQGTPTAFGTMPRIKAYRVAGTFNVGMYEFDSSVIFMPLPQAQIYFQLPNAVSDISVFVAKPDDVRAYDLAVANALGGRMRIFDWQQSNLSFFNAVEIERNVMFLILTLIIVVAAFNVISSMIMLVKDKGRDIAVLRTMGATR